LFGLAKHAQTFALQEKSMAYTAHVGGDFPYRKKALYFSALA